MGGIARLFGIGLVLFLATIAWLTLGGVTESRKNAQAEGLRGSVQSLWGSPQAQTAPRLVFEWTTERQEIRTESNGGVSKQIVETRVDRHERRVPLASTAIEVALASDLRRKGLLWYSLYDVAFEGVFAYVHAGPETGTLAITFQLPDENAIYDGYRFVVNGVDYGPALDESGSASQAKIPVAPGDRVEMLARYRSRGLDEWRYVPTEGVGRLEDFSLEMRTNFADIDFPSRTLSPSSRVRDGEGWRLSWRFEQLVSGFGIGMITPQRVQPGELAALLSCSAPISLFFFVGVVYVLAILRGLDIHPMNYLLIAGAFFAFHLLFAYSVDHLSIEVAFLLCSVVSVVLVVGYLRLVVSTRFAFVEAMIAQLVYLVGFSLAHFWEGYTGLTVTVLAIVTLGYLMQLTGRIRWSTVLARGAAPESRSPSPVV